MLSLSIRTLNHSLVIEALLISSFFSMPSPRSDLSLQVSSHAIKGILLVSLSPIFGVHKNFLLILSRSSLILFVNLK